MHEGASLKMLLALSYKCLAFPIHRQCSPRRLWSGTLPAKLSIFSDIFSADISTCKCNLSRDRFLLVILWISFSKRRRYVQAIKDVSTSHDALIENFLGRLVIYTKISPITAITEIIVKIRVELLSTLAFATQHPLCTDCTLAPLNPFHVLTFSVVPAACSSVMSVTDGQYAPSRICPGACRMAD